MDKKHFEELLQMFESNNIESIQKMLSMNLRMNLNKPPDSEEPLLLVAAHMDCGGDKIPIIDLLVEYGADLNILCSTGRSVLHYAIAGACENLIYPEDNREPLLSFSMIDYLVKKGVGLNTIDERGFSPLDIAVAYGSRDIVLRLLKYGCLTSDYPKEIIEERYLSDKIS